MWNLKPTERLHEWKAFRNQISDLPLDQAITETAHLWSYAPYVTHYLAAESNSEWPDPWTLLHENYYCDLAKTLGMFYTLALCSHRGKAIADLEIRVYKNIKTQDIVNTVWVNQGKYILNFTFDTIVNKTQIDENFILKYQYTEHDLQLDTY